MKVPENLWQGTKDGYEYCGGYGCWLLVAVYWLLVAATHTPDTGTQLN
jgi:hypothetical protein